MSNLLKYNSQTARYPLRRHCLSPLADCFIRHSTFFVVNYFPKITEITKTLFQEMSRDRSEDSTRATISLLRLLSLILFFVTDVKSSPRFNLEQMPREIEGGSSWSLRKNLIDACICLSRVYLSWPSRYRRYYGGGFERKKKNSIFCDIASFCVTSTLRWFCNHPFESRSRIFASRRFPKR